MTDAQPRRWFRDWTIWAALALVLIALVGFIGLWNSWRSEHDYRVGVDDPVVYSELIAQHAPNPPSDFVIDSNLLCGLVIFGIIIAVLMLIRGTKHKFIVIPLILSFLLVTTLSCGLLAIAVVREPIKLEDKGSANFNNYEYHIARGQVIQADGNYTIAILYRCDLDGTNCYGNTLAHGDDYSFESLSLEITDEREQLEVWDDGDVIYAISPNEE